MLVLSASGLTPRSRATLFQQKLQPSGRTQKKWKPVGDQTLFSSFLGFKKMILHTSRNPFAAAGIFVP